MMKTKTYNDFDTLKLFVKKDKYEEIVSNYKTFGWELAEKKENNKYEDIFDLTFERPHKIENKDELQLMQVYMEEKLNNLAKLERNKHPKTTSYGLIFGTFGLLFLLNGLLHIFNITPSIGLVGGIVMASFGLIFLISTAIVIPKLFKKENVYFETKSNQYKFEIVEICKKASSLSGGKQWARF